MGLKHLSLFSALPMIGSRNNSIIEYLINIIEKEIIGQDCLQLGKKIHSFQTRESHAVL